MKEITYKILKKTFTTGFFNKKKFQYDLILRNNFSVIYKVILSPENYHIGYEVFIIKKSKKGEEYAHENDFGKTAWSFLDYEDAFKKFESFRGMS